MTDTIDNDRPMTKPQKISVREADRRAARYNAQEGLKMTEAHAKLREKVLSGEMSEEEFRQRVIAEYRSN